MKTKMKLQFVFFFMCSLMIFSACTGDEGPIGETGPQGPEGSEGQVGPAGADGSVLYSGVDDPLSTTGQDGDYYLNTSTGELFGPKTSGEWTDSFSLIGADGADGADGVDGADGNTILSGTEIPGEAIGKDGDYYLDTDDILLYGPKVSDSWGAGLELKGADGNANVKSYSLTILTTDWEKTPYVSSTVYSESVVFPALTSAIHEEGAVLIYSKDISNPYIDETITAYTLLPLTEIMESGGVRSLKCDIAKSVVTTYTASLGIRTRTTYSLDFMYQFAWVVSGGLSDDITFKIVLIEGEFVELAKAYQDEGLEKMASEIGFEL